MKTEKAIQSMTHMTPKMSTEGRRRKRYRQKSKTERKKERKERKRKRKRKKGGKKGQELPEDEDGEGHPEHDPHDAEVEGVGHHRAQDQHQRSELPPATINSYSVTPNSSLAAKNSSPAAINSSATVITAGPAPAAPVETRGTGTNSRSKVTIDSGIVSIPAALLPHETQR
eukprot:738181-Rhodomonas_salina.1